MKSEINVGEVLTSLAIIESDNRLTEIFRTKYGTEFDMVRACIKGNLIKKKAVNEILKLAKLNIETIKLANHYLIDSEEANVIKQVNIIRQQLGKKPYVVIDHLDGVQVVEQFEHTFTVEGFLKEIGLKK